MLFWIEKSIKYMNNMFSQCYELKTINCSHPRNIITFDGTTWEQLPYQKHFVSLHRQNEKKYVAVYSVV